YKYQQHKREKESKKKQHVIQVKEVRFRPGTEKHDLETKGRKIREFLIDGAKVKITIMFRGREMAHQDFGHQTMNSILEMLDDIAKPDYPPKMEGRFLSTVLTPKT
ncbi:MAG TPA: translation initiation factor IF-3, partial [Candidatus Marinimicrobia bacterium]|nr:translation initiation factor IF-3 [Candidatus Neomarinimicrobiota bacterium]